MVHVSDLFHSVVYMSGSKIYSQVSQLG